MPGANSVPTQIVDKNGKKTTVHKGRAAKTSDKPKKTAPAPKAAKPVENEFLDGKPEWFRGYAQTVAEYVVKREYVLKPGVVTYGWGGEKVLSDFSKHMTDECSVGEVWDVYDQAEAQHVFDSFDPDRSEPVVYVSATVDCACGEYKKKSVEIQTTMSEAISGAFFDEEIRQQRSREEAELQG